MLDHMHLGDKRASFRLGEVIIQLCLEVCVVKDFDHDPFCGIELFRGQRLFYVLQRKHVVLVNCEGIDQNLGEQIFSQISDVAALLPHRNPVGSASASENQLAHPAQHRQPRIDQFQ